MTKKAVKLRVAGKTAPEAGAVLSRGITELRFLSWRELQEFKPHQMNWKVHPQGQKNAVNAAIETIGYAGAILVNQTTRTLLDGHLRASEAIKKKQARIPVLFGSWTAEEELVVLQTFDTTGAAFEIDAAAFDSLTKVVQNQGKKLVDALKSTQEKTSIQRLTQGAASLAKKLMRDGGDEGERYQPLDFSMPKPSRTKLFDEGSVRQIGVSEDGSEEEGRREQKPEEDEELDAERSIEGEGSEERSRLGEESDRLPSIYTQLRLRADVVFDVAEFCSDGDSEIYRDPYGIPALHEDVDDPERYVQANDAPTAVTWDRSAATMTSSSIFCYSAGPNFPPEKEGGFLSFHTEDQRFVGAWNDVVKFVQRLEQQEWKGVFEPEFSVTSELPAAVSLFNLYRSRYLARYWQEYFIPIIPLLRSYGWFDDDPIYPCRLIRQGTPVVACQARNMRRDEIASKTAVLRSMFEYAVEEIGVQVIVVYGGKDYEKYLKGTLYKPTKVEYVLAPSFMSARRDRM